MKCSKALLLTFAIWISHALIVLASDSLDVAIEGKTDDLISTLPKLAPELVRRWSAATAELLALDRNVPQKVTVIFTDDVKNAGETSDTTIRISRDTMKRIPGDHGLLVHELVHVLQAYPPQRAPGWITEGIADWIRYFHFEPERGRIYYQTGADPTWGRRDLDYKAGYMPAAALLEYLRREYDPNLLWRLNAVLRSGEYTDEFFAKRGIADLDSKWKEFTSKWPEAGRR